MAQKLVCERSAAVDVEVFAWFNDNASEERVGVLLSAPRPVSPPRSLSPTPGHGPVRSLVRLAGTYFADGCVCLFAATPDEFCGGSLAMEVRGVYAYRPASSLVVM